MHDASTIFDQIESEVEASLGHPPTIGQSQWLLRLDVDNFHRLRNALVPKYTLEGTSCPARAVRLEPLPGIGWKNSFYITPDFGDFEHLFFQSLHDTKSCHVNGSLCFVFEASNFSNVLAFDRCQPE